MAKDKGKKEEAEGEKPEGEEGAAEGEGKKGGKKKLIILAAVALLVLGGGVFAGLYFTGIIGHKDEATGEEHEGEKEEGKESKESKADKKEKKGKKEDKKSEKDEHKSEKKEEGDGHGGGDKGKEGANKDAIEGPDGVIYYDLPSFLVNLNSAETKRTSFLKMTVSLELASSEDQSRIELMKPRLIDTFNTYLRELRPSDLNGSAGLQRLREELMVRINETVHPARVNDILFKEVIVQ